MADNKIITQNFFVITGGPGVGKTTLLNELNSREYNYIPEAARQIIKEQMEMNGNALPWENTTKYKALMLEKSITDYQLAKPNIITFFDRGIPDTLCYSKVLGETISTEEDTAARKYRYNNKVFLLPPWREIYVTDTERKQDWEEAVRTYELMKTTYMEYGYEIIEVPKISVKERADFILKCIEK
ncbi:hypothetical protein D3C87_127400 [compost metagenome]